METAKSGARRGAGYVAEVCTCEVRPAKIIRGPDDVAGLFWESVHRDTTREHFVCFDLNSRNVPLAVRVVSVGSLNASIVHPREVFAPALKNTAASIIMAHNHPSGDPTPSEEDLAITRRLFEAGRLLGVELLDHVVVEAGGAWVSLRERRILK